MMFMWSGCYRSGKVFRMIVEAKTEEAAVLVASERLQKKLTGGELDYLLNKLVTEKPVKIYDKVTFIYS